MESSLLNWIIFLPLIGSVLVLIAPAKQARTIAWVATFAVFLLSCLMFGPFLPGSEYWSNGHAYGQDMQFTSTVPWIEVGDFHIDWRVGLDGISFPLIILTTLITWLSAWASRKRSSRKPRPCC